MKDLKKFRQEIDIIDKKLLKILSQRFSLTRKIGLYKLKKCLPIRDTQREKEMLKNRLILAKKLNLDSTLVKKIFTFIPKVVIKENKKIKKN
jgi:chorismate mutase